jgi:hypothetical protein
MWSRLYSSRPARLAQSRRGAVKRLMLSTDAIRKRRTIRQRDSLEHCGLETRQYGAVVEEVL